MAISSKGFLFEKCTMEIASRGFCKKFFNNTMEISFQGFERDYNGNFFPRF